MTDNQPKNLQEKILQSIKSGELKPRSKWYFYSQSIVLAGVLILAGLLLLFLGSLIVFSLQQNGAWYSLGFGFYGFKILFVSLPWLLILAVVVLLVLVERLLKHYKFSYRQPLLYSFVTVGLVFAVGTILVSRVHLHEELFMQAREHKLVFGSPVYRHYGMPPKGSVTRGIVFLVNDPGCKIKTLSDEELQVIITTQTKLPFNYSCAPGDSIIVLGPRSDDSIRAIGIIKTTDPFYQNFNAPLPSPIILQPQFTQ